MARVRLVEKADAAPEVKEVYQKLEDNGALVGNIYKAVANSPQILLNFIRLGNVIVSKTGLTPKMRELIILRVAKLANSEYEWAQHTVVALSTGVTQKQLDVITDFKKSSEFSDEEKAVLQYTDEVARNIAVTDQTFETLKKFYDEKRIVEVTLVVGYYGMLARIIEALKVDIDKTTIGSATQMMGKRAQSK